MESVLENAIAHFDTAARILRLTDSQIATIKEPRRVTELRLPVRMDDGSVRLFTGYRVQHSVARGPSHGGIRFHPATSLEEMKALAFWNTYRCAAIGIPFSGSQGGVVVDPATLSVNELERLTRRYFADLVEVFGEDQDVAGIDLGTDAQVMAWAMDTYSMHHRRHAPAAITGKPLEVDGSAGREQAMALGLLPCLREGAAQLRLELPRCRVAIEGFGQIGASIAELLVRQGCLVTAISDASGGYHHDKGLDVAAAARHLAEHGSLAGFDRVSFAARLSEPAKLLGLPVDVLLTAGRDLTLSGEQALRVQARLVAECARGAIDPIADEVLGGRGVLILPDILCTAGGVTVSYLEWVQNRTGYYWNEARVVEDVERILLESWRKVGRTALEYGVSTRVAAFIVAIDRVTRTSELRGLYA